MNYTTGEFLGYSIAWKGSDGVVHIACGQARPLSEARLLLEAARVEWPTIKHFLIEVHEALQEPEPLPEPELAEVLQ